MGAYEFIFLFYKHYIALMNVALNTREKRRFSWIVKKGANQYRELNFDTSQGGVGGA